LDILGLSEGINPTPTHKHLLFADRKVLFHEFEYDEDDFSLWIISLADFHFTKNNFDKKINQLLHPVDACFNEVDAILFATGIYELTNYNIEGISKIEDINHNVLSKFPMIFFKKGYEQNFQDSYTYNNTCCIVNFGKDVQDIFANSATALLEDAKEQ